MKNTTPTGRQAGCDITARILTLTPFERLVFSRRIQPFPPKWSELSTETGKAKEYLVVIWLSACHKMLTPSQVTLSQELKAELEALILVAG